MEGHPPKGGLQRWTFKSHRGIRRWLWPDGTRLERTGNGVRPRSAGHPHPRRSSRLRVRIEGRFGSRRARWQESRRSRKHPRRRPSSAAPCPPAGPSLRGHRSRFSPSVCSQILGVSSASPGGITLLADKFCQGFTRLPAPRAGTSRLLVRVAQRERATDPAFGWDA